VNSDERRNRAAAGSNAENLSADRRRPTDKALKKIVKNYNESCGGHEMAKPLDVDTFRISRSARRSRTKTL